MTLFCYPVLFFVISIVSHHGVLHSPVGMKERFADYGVFLLWWR
jgi:hypothetical protein